MKKLCLILLSLFALLIFISVVIALIEQKGISLHEKVALVRIEGPIMDSKKTVDELKEHVKDPSIKAIVLRVDSPGGGVAASQEIYDEVKKAVSKKKVVASMGSVAASGGYYVLVPATKIVANPGTLTGSIGVIMEIPNVEGLMDKIGIKTQVIKSGKHKDIASIFRKMGDDERKILQGVMDDVHEQFIMAVAEGRRLPVEDVRKIADGRVFTGRQAMELALVDEMGTLEDAIAISARLAGIKGEPEVVSKKEKFSLVEMLRGGFSGRLSEFSSFMSLKYILSP